MAKYMIISYFLNKVKRGSDSNGREILTSAWVQAKCNKPALPPRHDQLKVSFLSLIIGS